MILTTGNLKVSKRKPINDNFIDASIYAWKTWKWYRPCVKSVFTECSNMADLVNRTQNPHHNQAKWSFYIAQRNKLNRNKLACRIFLLFKQRFEGIIEMKIEREDNKESMCKTFSVLGTVIKSGPFLAKRHLWTTYETYFAWPTQRFK